MLIARDSAPVRVLVVDDNLEMATTLCEGLVERGYLATAAGSGKEGLALLATQPFDVLITDLRMPRVDGFALLSASRQLDPERPVIAMTAVSSLDGSAEALRRGAFSCLMKPFRQDELCASLARALENTTPR